MMNALQVSASSKLFYSEKRSKGDIMKVASQQILVLRNTYYIWDISRYITNLLLKQLITLNKPKYQLNTIIFTCQITSCQINMKVL